MADNTMMKSVGILCDVFIKVAFFIFLVDFIIIDCQIDFNISIILESPFLSTGRALFDMEMR